MNETTQESGSGVTELDVEIEIKPHTQDKPDEMAMSDGVDEPLPARLEVVIISSDSPLPEPRLAELLGLSGTGTAKTLREAIDDLNKQYAKTGRTFRIEKLAGGWQMHSQTQFGPLLAKLHSERQSAKLSHAALETLAIVSYRQPVIRAEIEAIRGVACGEVLRGLLERRLIKITGRSEELGRPMLYGTTKEFLKVFGLSRIDDLPDVEGLSPPKRQSPKKPSKETPKAEFEAESAETTVADESTQVEASSPEPDQVDPTVPEDSIPDTSEKSQAE